MTPTSRRHWLVASAAVCGSQLAAAAGPGYLLLENKPGVEGQARGSVTVFEGKARESSQTVLARWARQAGWNRPVWRRGVAPEVFLNENIYVEGDFASAVRALFREHRGLRQRAQPVLNFGARELIIEAKPR